jgi:hypothetical protein
MNRKTITTLVAAIVMAFSPALLLAQKKLTADIEAKLVSKYMWRGIDMGGISFQPSAQLSWKGLYMGLDGNKSFDNEGKEELDVSLGYRAPFGLNIGVTDYWTDNGENVGQYFFYKKLQTAHQLEGNLGYSCKYFSLQGYCIFWGNDYKLLGIDKKQAYSTYISVDVPFRLGGLDWNVSAGMTPMESSGSEVELTDENGEFKGWLKDYTYADGPACVSAAVRMTKTLNLKTGRLPIFVELHTNPYRKTACLLAGISFKTEY